MTIYIVTQGEYSDYGIKAVFTNKEQAMLYAALHNDDYYEPCMVEEYEADAFKVETSKEIYKKWLAIFDSNKVLEYCKPHCGYFFKSPYTAEFNMFNFKYYVEIYVPVDTSEEKAKKIACDYFAKWRYEQEELRL